MRTQVAVVGSGPAGLLLSQILHQHGIEAVILEQRNRAYVEGRMGGRQFHGIACARRHHQPSSGSGTSPKSSSTSG